MHEVQQNSGHIIVKVGGSLYALPDLGHRLRRWIATQSSHSVLLVPGGGAVADAIRHIDRTHHLGEEVAHWLALRALTLNAHWLQRLLPEAEIVATFRGSSSTSPLYILDAHAFATEDEHDPQHLPHTWDATSDSVAARAAVVFQANRLVLLKSASVPRNISWQEASKRGFVDPVFPRILSQATHAMEVEAINLRSWEPSEADLPTVAPFAR